MGSVFRTIIFTIGHFIIAIAVLKTLDPDIETWVAMADAVVEPLINSIWYYILDRIWISKLNNNKKYEQ